MAPGTIAHASGTSALAVLGAAALALQSCPWLVPAVTLPPDEERLEPLVDLIGELRNRVAVVQPAAIARIGPAAALIAAVCRRPLPWPEMLSGYVNGRLGPHPLREAIAEQFSRALGQPQAESRSVATYSRLFARYGPYTARDWRALARLAHDICVRQSTRSQRPTGPVGQGATDISLDPQYRTANRHARRLVGISLRDAGEALGWECVIEQAFRRGGYVRVPRASYAPSSAAQAPNVASAQLFRSCSAETIAHRDPGRPSIHLRASK